MRTNLPKQIKHWMQKIGFTPDLDYKKSYHRNYYKSKNRKLRVLDLPPLGVFVQVSDTNFDRWANSVDFSFKMGYNMRETIKNYREAKELAKKKT